MFFLLRIIYLTTMHCVSLSMVFCIDSHPLYSLHYISLPFRLRALAFLGLIRLFPKIWTISRIDCRNLDEIDIGSWLFRLPKLLRQKKREIMLNTPTMVKADVLKYTFNFLIFSIRWDTWTISEIWPQACGNLILSSRQFHKYNLELSKSNVKQQTIW